MSQANVLALVQLLSNGEADTTLQMVFYDEGVIELAEKLWLTTTAVLFYTAGQSTVSLPADLIETLSIFYDNEALTEMSLEELLYLYGDNWRQRKGRPTAYTRESETNRIMEVSPTPQITSPVSTDVNAGYQPYSGAIIYSQTRTDVPTYLELPLALMILKREYWRESPHQDRVMGGLCGQLAEMLLGMLEARPTLP